MLRRNSASEQATIAEVPARPGQEFDIVLTPVSHPELGEIRIGEDLFAIGRTEPPFDSYAPDIVADLSRRHARIFSEGGAVYIADLDSKNGTTVNSVGVQQKITRLKDGDEICFGRALSYRVQLGARSGKPGRTARLVDLTLHPDRHDLGLQPIIVTQFPFLISKADDTFARYREEYPHQVNYISRRHAHIFLKGGEPFVEDLGSTNGTFVGGKRLDEHAVALRDGEIIAFGGHHFVYKASLQKEDIEVDPTVTKLASVAPAKMEEAANSDKTTFVAAADSFLEIFCVDHAQQQDDEVNDEAQKHAEDAGKESGKRAPRSRLAIFVSELTDAFAGTDRSGMRRAFRWGSSFVALLAGVGIVLYLTGAPERRLRNLMASGEYAQAATIAGEGLKRTPENAELRELGTQALLKAYVPEWAARLKNREYDRAAAVLARMRESGRHNADAQPLIRELEMVGSLESFVMGRGGVEAPIRLYADEEKIKSTIRQWEEDPQGHQRAFATISSQVPEFKDPYADALSHLRKLQSDDAVYLAAIERLKTAIATELTQSRPEALEPLLKEYAEKYPRIGGMDNVRRDLRQYLEIENEVRDRRTGRLIALLAKANFSTPPFQASFRALGTNNRLPPADIIGKYQAASRAWRQGDMPQTFAVLEKLASGPWAELGARELAHKKALAEQFSALQKARGAKGYEEQLLAFYGSLDPDEDAYFIKATEADAGPYRNKALGRAQELLNQAQASWRQYKDNGAIEGAQRLEARVSNEFRTQARLLTEANENVQQGGRIYRQLKADVPAQWSKMQEEIGTEADVQRRSLLELRTVLEPELWKAKLALLGGRSNEERKHPQAAQ